MVMKRSLSAFLCFCMLLSSALLYPNKLEANAEQPVTISGGFAHEPVQSATVESLDGIPTLHINGRPEPLIAWFQWGWYPRSTEASADAGIHIYQPRHTTGYPTLEVWLPEMEKILQEDPDAYFLPILWLGSDMSFGFDSSNSAEWNVDKGASWGANSYGSAEWKNRAELFLREQIRRYEASPVGDRILGYMLSGGSTGEWFNVDTWANRDFDRSLGNLATFRDWLKLTYHSDVNKLRAAWGDANVTFESASIPAKRNGNPFLNPESDRPAIDYVQYQNGQLSRFVAYLSGVVKEEAGHHKLMSIYSGYTLAFGQFGPISGELDFNTLLESPDIDLIYSPLDYTRRNLSDGFSSVHGAMDSARLHGKLYVAEDDYATHIGTDTHGAPPLSDNVEGSLALLWRNFGLSLTKSYGQHWYDDAGYGGFNNALMMKEIRKMNQLAKASIGLPRQSGAEIALVVDEFSQMVQSSSASHLNERLRLIRDELSQTGAPYDIVLLSDVLAGRADQYKLYVFANAYALDEEQRSNLEQWDRTGKTLVWLYASGYWKRDLNGVDSRSAAQMEEVIGIPISESAAQAYTLEAANAPLEPLLQGIAPGTTLGGSTVPIPLFSASEAEGVKVLGRSGGLATAAYKDAAGGSEVWIGSPSISSVQLYRNLADKAGVHLYSRSGKQVNANESFVFVTLPAAVTDSVYFPDALPKYDVTNERIVYPGQDGKLDIATAGPQTLVFYNGDGEDLALVSGGSYSTELSRLVVRLSGETLEKQKLESVQARQLDMTSGSHTTLDVTGITPGGFYLYQDEMTEAPVWSSSDEAVAIVSSNGQLSALDPGTAVITATVGAIAATAELTVKQPLEQSLLPLLETATWSTWSMNNGWHPFTLGAGNAYGKSQVMEEVLSEDGQTYTDVYRYEPLQSGEQVSGSVDSISVPNKAGVKAVATFRYPAGTPEGTYNSVIFDSYREGGAGSLFVVQKDLPVTGTGTTIEADLSAYAGQRIRIDVNVRNKSVTDITYGKVDLTDFKLVYEDTEPQKTVRRLEFAEINKSVPVGATDSLAVQQVYSDGSRDVWAPGQDARFYSDRPDLVAITNQGQIEALGKGTASITLVTNDYLARAYVHVIGNEYVFEDLLPVYAEEGAWTIEPGYAPFLFGQSESPYGGAARPASVMMEDGQSYDNPIVFSGSETGTGINGRITMEVPDAQEVHLTGKFGFIENEDYESRTSTFYMRSWDAKQPFYNNYPIHYDGKLEAFDIDVSAFRGQSLSDTDIYVLKPDQVALDIGLVELKFRVKAPDTSGPIAIMAERAHTVLSIGGEERLSVKELTDAGNYRLSSLPVVWSTEQTDTVLLDSNGVVKGLQPGIAIVQADMGSLRAQMVVEVRPDGLTRGQAADPYRWTSLERLPQFSIMEADTPYRYAGLRLREPVMPAPVVASPSTPITTQEQTYAIAGSAAPGALIQVWNDRNGNGWWDNLDTLVAALQMADSESAYAIQVPVADAGQHRFLVTGSNAIGERSAEAVVPVITYEVPSGGHSGSGVIIAPDTGLISKADGSPSPFASGAFQMFDGRRLLKVELNAGKIMELLALNNKSVLSVRLTKDSDAVFEGLTAADMKRIGDSQGDVTIRTPELILPLQADRFDWEKIAAALGTDDLSDIRMKWMLERWSSEEAESLRRSASSEGYVWEAMPVSVHLAFSYKGKTIDAIGKNGSPTQLWLLLGSDTDMNTSADNDNDNDIVDAGVGGIPTGVSIGQNGAIYPIPTKVEHIDGQLYAVLHNLASHDSYAVISYAKRFTDMIGHWGENNVFELASRLVTQGVGGASFDPSRSVLRKEFTALLVRGLGIMQDGEKPSSFSDVKAGSWESMPIEIGYEAGIVSGMEAGQFHGDRKLSRQQGMVMAANALRFARGEGEIPMTMDEADSILSEFKDESHIAAWARSAIAYLCKEGIVRGNGNGSLLPGQAMNRVEAVSLVLRVLKHSQLI
ncbi:S-layer homology domain-containing protein [Paenibacillus sp. J5C_2022]|uniref:S-layer homology domain-containing protein n=1 Tax=Paenibacillus sp. J5C2022 TaxID=2977129 RepID=UPI0021D185AC|nr:S-layer homology domain-containing protein [Paenibacillus sp. J5C2022]MCU6709961.1 S-layer homology domain-containing protein [Paenibacillus sp. J5C2022]